MKPYTTLHKSPLLRSTPFKAVLLTVIALPILSARTLGQVPDPAIKALLTQSSAAYDKIDTLSMTLDEVQTHGAVTSAITSKIKLKKPNLLSAEIVMGPLVSHVVADGTSIYSDTSRDKSHYRQIHDTGLVQALSACSESGGMGVALIPRLLTIPKSMGLLVNPPNSVAKLLAEQTIAGEPCDILSTVVGKGPQAFQYKFAFGKKDHLLRQLTIGPAADGAKPTVVETYADIDLHPPVSAATFKYTPPAGAADADVRKEELRFNPRLKVGSSPFPFSAKDINGKGVSLQEYKGKVVLLSFWATYYRPCIVEAPELVALYNKYHGQGLEIIGVSLDHSNAKDKVEKFAHDEKMPWPEIYDGKFWKTDVATTYGVTAIPFTLLIGRDGKIEAVDLRGPALMPAIEAAFKK